MKIDPSKNKGFSLLEILISLVIMSVGMMGLAGLKVVAIKGANESHFRQEATLFMADMADRMRSNEVAVDAGNYQQKTPVNSTTMQPPPTDCGSETCTAFDLSFYDKYQIVQRMAKAIPDSFLSITCPNDSCSSLNNVKVEHTITISWKEQKQKGEDISTNKFNERKIELTIIP